MTEKERRQPQLVCIRVTIFQDLSKLTQDNGSSSLYPSSHSKCPFVFILVSPCQQTIENLSSHLHSSVGFWMPPPQRNFSKLQDMVKAQLLNKQTCTFNEQYIPFISFIVGSKNRVKHCEHCCLPALCVVYLDECFSVLLDSWERRLMGQFWWSHAC